MPTYSYACTACEHQFEAVQQFTDPSLTDCPVCSGRLRKLFSSVGIVFKGSGFYRTDSRASRADKPNSDKSNSDKSNSNGKSEGKSDTTPSESTATGSKTPTSAKAS